MRSLSDFDGFGGFQLPPTAGQPPWATPGINPQANADGGVFGKMPILGGLFGRHGQQQEIDPRREALMAAAASLMANSGYQPTRVTNAQAIGQALLAGQQSRTQALDAIAKQREQEQMARYREAQLEALQNRTPELEVIVGEDGRPTYVPRGEAIGKQPYERSSSLAEPPASLQELDRVNEARLAQGAKPYTPEEWFRIRASMAPRYGEVGGVLSALTPGGAQPLGTLQAEVDAARSKAAGTEGGKIAGGAQAQASVDLPQAVAGAEQTIGLVQALRDHPGLGIAVGASSVIPTIPGTDAADFNALREQIKGKQFLEAYQALKGGGQITQIEGEKAEAAIARMQTAQSEKAFKAAADEFIEYVTRGVQRARAKAGQPGQSSAGWSITPVQ